MNRHLKLTMIKVIHTIIWIFFNVLLFYMLQGAIRGKITTLFWIGCGFVLLEGIVLLIFRWTCPLSILARKYTDDTNDNFDIYLPNWLARHTKTIYTSLFIMIILLALYRILIAG